ncbi:hypothetical protein Taro_003036 [Colocasia esculenta]|uniref:Retrotransposon gag domain-containing protein n=1 Tax=Colocasia esculenta TaxID=4460 RepID=A0A843TFX1_COLES|nr:hypothetical protein [Colocasia esculenta]
MWTLRVAVAIGGIGVDANLRMVQVIGSPEGRFLTWFFSPRAPASRPGTEEWLDDRRMRGVAELREETSRCGAILVGTRGGFGVNREIAEVGCPRFFVSQAVSSGICPGTCVVPSTSVSSDLDTLTLVFELHVRLRERRQWDSDTCVRARRTSHDRRPAQGRAVAVQGQYLSRCSFSYVVLQQCSLASCLLSSVVPRENFEMADRRDWGGGGNDPEESTQRMIERIWESLTDIRARMDQQAPVPPVAVPPGEGEAVPVAVPPRVEVPFTAPVPPPPPVLIAEEPVMQVEKFLRLQPPTYSGGPNPDTAEHWVHEIERVFATMRCPVADRVVLAAYQLRGFALEWWRLKMQTTFAGRTEDAITWLEFLDVFNDTFFPIQVQQVKREQFRTLQQVGRR